MVNSQDLDHKNTTFWTINRVFQSGFHTTIQKLDYLTTQTYLPFKYQTILVFRWFLYINEQNPEPNEINIWNEPAARTKNKNNVQ